MDLGHAFPAFDEARVIHRGDGLLVVDKPAGVPSQAADPEVPDDLPARLKGLAEYLGTHQRLDAETSGLVLFTTEKSANAKIAEQFEKRRIKKTYVACVEKFRGQKKTLEDVIDGKKAVMHARVIERRGERAMLEIDLETGRTHQARIQLQRAGSPIAGDALYGGPAAPRLMLHAMGLDVVAPNGKNLTLRAPIPEEMREWLERGDRGERVYDDEQALRASMALAFERRWDLLRAMPEARATDVFRLANDEGDALPGLTIDFYAGFAVASFSRDFTSERRARILDAIASFGFDGVYEKSRPKDASALTATQREALAPKTPSRGEPASSPLVVHEEGLPYLVRLDDGLATGFYADQRKNRRRVRAVSGGARVLNLFSYTCAFSVAADAGGAARVVSVDASASFLERGRENVIHAGLDLAKHEFVAQDAKAWLDRAVRKKEQFDLIILDPPSYGTAGGKRFAIASDFVPLCSLAMRLLAPRGQMLASINHRKTSQNQFRHAVQWATREAPLDAAVRDLPPPLDFPAHGEPNLKAVWVVSRRI
ncbi:MAG TPA: class I SAM-dependent methyltransferase [Polyangiaceae bacterium]|jgi:23S rRNA (cytosine1962-C5)-methyltransferase